MKLRCLLFAERTAAFPNGERGFNHYLCGYPPTSLQMYKTFLQNYDLKG